MTPPYKEIKKKFPFITPEDYKNIVAAELADAEEGKSVASKAYRRKQAIEKIAKAKKK